MASVAGANVSPALEVKELSTKGADSPVAYLVSLNRRGPMLATCFGSKETALEAEPFEAFLDVAASGVPGAVNVSNVGRNSTPELEACLLNQLGKVRFPEAESNVEVKVVLGPVSDEEKGRRGR